MPRAGSVQNLRAWWIAGLAFCLFMLGVHVAASLNANGFPDSWRDLWWATAIAHGERFPLAGPPIYGMLELGPWWFYLLAVPMAITHSLAWTSAFAQALAALKYFLAWRLGLRIADARLGFVFAVCLAIPGWSTVTLIFPTHTALVETLLFALAFAAMRCWRQFAWREAVLLGLVGAACLHAHPTTLSYVALCGAIVLWRHRSLAACGWMLLSATIVVLSVAPPLFDHSDTTTEALKPIAAYLDRDIGVHPLARIPALLRGLALGGVWWGLGMATLWRPEVLAIAYWLTCACLAFAALGCMPLKRHAPHLFRLAIAIALLLAAQATFLVLLRPVTPMWMVPSCLPPLALLIAMAWYGWLITPSRAWRRGAIAVMGVYLVLSLVPFSLELRDVRKMRQIEHDNPLSDAGARGGSFSKVDVAFYPVRWLDKLAGSLCASQVLHGRLAAVVETSLASAQRNACGHWPALRYGGVAGSGPHVAGMLDWMAQLSKLPPARVVAHMALYDNVLAIAPPQGGTLAALHRRQINPVSGAGPLRPLDYAFTTNTRDEILLTNRLPNAAPMTIRNVQANGRPAQLLGADDSSFLYRCADCAADAKAQWRVQVEAIEANLDLVVLPADPLVP